MTKLSQSQPDPDFYLQVEDFIISAASVDINGDHALNTKLVCSYLACFISIKSKNWNKSFAT